MERPAAFFFLSLAAGMIIGDWCPGHLSHVLLGALGLVAILRFIISSDLRVFLVTAGVFLVLGYVAL